MAAEKQDHPEKEVRAEAWDCCGLPEQPEPHSVGRQLVAAGQESPGDAEEVLLVHLSHNQGRLGVEAEESQADAERQRVDEGSVEEDPQVMAVF